MYFTLSFIEQAHLGRDCLTSCFVLIACFGLGLYLNDRDDKLMKEADKLG
jgi:hypothetical protein